MYANEHVDVVNALGIKTAPTLVVVNGDEVHKCAGVSEIKKMLNQ